MDANTNSKKTTTRRRAGGLAKVKPVVAVQKAAPAVPSAAAADSAALAGTAPVKGEKAVAENTRKWGVDIVEAGWIFLPSTLVLKRAELGMDAVDLNILLVLLQYWWQADNLPFPTKATIAGLVGIDASNVRKRLAKLEEKGLITRTVRPKGGSRHDSNLYSFEGLIEKAKPYALEISGERRNSGAKSFAGKMRRAAAAKGTAS